MACAGGRCHRTVLIAVCVALLVLFIPRPGAAGASTALSRPTVGQRQQIDAQNLDAAAAAVEVQALASGALRQLLPYTSSAKILLASTVALTKLARAQDPSRAPTKTTAIMGPVPHNIWHHLRHRPRHYGGSVTHTLSLFSHSIPDGGSSGIGHVRKHDGARPAPFQRPDGVLVDPHLQAPVPATIGLVAIRAALRELGQPYVWGGAGPRTFDCSGLVQWAYAHAGLRLTHHAADQWNEGRLIPGMDILPGDLVMFGGPIFHVGMYLGAGWMINAPDTGQYVNVVPVPPEVAGVVRP
jgi:cell wall-associated NlpC family hydrolase